MKRSLWRDLASGTAMGAAIVASMFLARDPGASSASLLAGPALLALATMVADSIDSRSWPPSWPALLLAASFLLAGAIAAARGSSLVLDLLPVFGGGASVAVLVGTRNRSRSCESP